MMFFDKKKKALKKLEKLAKYNDNINTESVKNLIINALLIGSITPDKAVTSFESFLVSGIVPNLYF